MIGFGWEEGKIRKNNPKADFTSHNKRACCTTHRSIMKFQKDGVLIALNKLVIDI